MINNYRYLFSNENYWSKNRDKTFFKSIDEVEKYQSKRLDFLKFDLSKEPSYKLPKVNKNVKSISMRRSGTTSVSSEREYFYSTPEYEIMEKHHIWKLEKSNNISNPGNVVWICSLDHDLRNAQIYGPSKLLSLGENNTTYIAYYNNTFGKAEWMQILKAIKKINPKFVRASPSIIEVIYYLFEREYQFNCPVILSEETLHGHTRTMCELIFKDVIDKMVSWDGCLGWFECPFKTKHIYDEFCYVEQLEDNTLLSTDLNNRSMNFIKYINGDKGIVDKKICDCGLAGNYFKEFYGKTIESLYVGNDIKEIISGRFISEKLSVLIRQGEEFNELHKSSRKTFPLNFVYRIKQNLNLELDFIYSAEEALDLDLIILIRNMLNRIIWNNRNCQKINFLKEDIQKFQFKQNRRSKNLFIESDYLKHNKFNLVSKKHTKLLL